MSLAGSNPEGAKAPQGDFHAREKPSENAVDSIADIAEGKSAYETNCASCHRMDGGGVIGPNLVDEYWLHGGKPEQISNSIAQGIPEKGMIAWGPILGPKKIREVVSYIVSIQGSSPKDPKAPQGNKEE
jgi:cytochrome c oxidase cbb3-type subunit 3